MDAIIRFAYFIIDQLLWLTIIVVIAYTIVSTLVSFDVINLRNRFAYAVARFLEAVTRPLLAPFRRIMPVLGGVDLSPLMLVLILIGIRAFLLPAAAGALLRLDGSGPPL